MIMFAVLLIRSVYGSKLICHVSNAEHCFRQNDCVTKVTCLDWIKWTQQFGENKELNWVLSFGLHLKWDQLWSFKIYYHEENPGNVETRDNILGKEWCNIMIIRGCNFTHAMNCICVLMRMREFTMFPVTSTDYPSYH